MLKWVEGRQGGGYSKLLLAINHYFKFDMYILRYPPRFELPWHTDPCLKGYEHHRINIRLLGKAIYFERIKLGTITNLNINSKLVHPCDDPLKATAVVSSTKRVNKIRPDLHEHRVKNLNCWTYTLSIGWLKRSRNV